jgi:hypothetical protein
MRKQVLQYPYWGVSAEVSPFVNIIASRLSLELLMPLMDFPDLSTIDSEAEYMNWVGAVLDILHAGFAFRSVNE